MSIIIANAEPEEALNYNHIFMDELRVIQTPFLNVGDLPQYSVSISYRKFAVDSTGKAHFTIKNNTIRIENYLPLALEKAASGDTDLLNALGAIELAIAQIIEEQTELSVAVQ